MPPLNFKIQNNLIGELEAQGNFHSYRLYFQHSFTKYINTILYSIYLLFIRFIAKESTVH